MRPCLPHPGRLAAAGKDDSLVMTRMPIGHGAAVELLGNIRVSHYDMATVGLTGNI